MEHKRARGGGADVGQNLPGYTQRSRRGSFRRHCTLSLTIGDKSRADAASASKDIMSFSRLRKLARDPVLPHCQVGVPAHAAGSWFGSHFSTPITSAIGNSYLK